MRKSLMMVAAMALPLAACATSPYGTGYGYDPVTSAIGVLGGVLGASQGGYGYNSGYGGSFSQAAVNACGSTAARYGQVSIRNVRQLDQNHLKVFGYVNNGYRSEGWDCTFRSDGRITDFDL